jgi:hypothetical protein
MLDDGLINKAELIEICNLIKAINTKSPEDLEDTLKRNLRPLRLETRHIMKIAFELNKFLY